MNLQGFPICWERRGWVEIGGGSDSFSHVKSPSFPDFLLNKLAAEKEIYFE